MSAPAIVLVEDDPALRTLTARALQENGYSVRQAATAPEMWLAFDNGPVDLVLLDIMLPGTSGIDLCREVRRKSDVPIIFISAKGNEHDRVLGLELGADDYLAKPFSTRELIARIRAVLRRGGLERMAGGDRETQAHFDGWTVNFPRREVKSPSGAVVELTGAEFDLLAAFLSQPQRVIARERLVELSRVRLGDSSDRSVDVLVSRLRRKISAAGHEPPIGTVRGIGYIFRTEVNPLLSLVPRHPLGLLGRILLILLLTVAVEFGASTFLYERASRYSIEESDAHRLAEHLIIAEKLLSERPVAERPAAAQELTTDRYIVRWSPNIPVRPAFPPRQKRMEAQVTNWEKDLAESHLQLRLAPAAHGQVVAGEMRMADGSWIVFKTREAVQVWQFAIERTLVALVPALLLLTLGALLIRGTLLPLRKLIHAIGHVGSGKRVTVEEEGTAEIRGLIHAFNGMQRRIHELIENRTQALAAVGHDLRTPLARLQLRLEAVEDEEGRRAMQEDVSEMDDMIASLLTFLRGQDDPEPAVAVDVAVMAATLVEDATDRGREARYSGPRHLEWNVRPSMLRRALSNLIENALHYGKSVQITVVQDGNELIFRVEDDGPGIPPDQIEEALRPFVRLDVERGRNTKGMGLGLAIVQQAVALEKGRLTLANAPQGGLIAEIRLPN